MKDRDYHIGPVSDRLVFKTKRRATGCIEFLGHITDRGYGQINLGNNVRQLAHRTSYRLFVGEVPKGLRVLHRCDNPICVHPAHLFVGTAKDNSQDMVRKGRSAFGERSAAAKLTDRKVFAIRRHLDAGMSQAELGRRFGVSNTSIKHIAHRDTWRHVP